MSKATQQTNDWNSNPDSMAYVQELTTTFHFSQDVWLWNYKNELEGNAKLFGILKQLQSVSTLFKRSSLNGYVAGQLQSLVNKS